MPHVAGTRSTSRPDPQRGSTGSASARTVRSLAAPLATAQRILESGACPLFLIDMSAAIGYVSPALEALTGYVAGELLGRSWTRFFAAESDCGTLDGCPGEPSDAPRTHLAMITRHKNGAVLHLDAAVTPLRNDAGLVVYRVFLLRDVTAERRERLKLEFRALHDPLTGLANRHLLRDRFELAVARARRHGEHFAIVMIDLNGFKLVNDRFGHHVGDAVLRGVSKRLRLLVRAEDTVARLGGDEFVLLVAGIDSSHSPPGVVDRLRASLSRPIVVAPGALTIGCCAGSARFPDDGCDLPSLLKVADARLYADKARAERARLRRVGVFRRWVAR